MKKQICAIIKNTKQKCILKINKSVSFKWLFYSQLYAFTLVFCNAFIGDNFAGVSLVTYPFIFGGASFSILKTNKIFDLKCFFLFGMLFCFIALISIIIGVLAYQISAIETIGILGFFSFSIFSKIAFDSYKDRFFYDSYLALLGIFLLTYAPFIFKIEPSDFWMFIMLFFYVISINFVIYFDLRKL